MLVPVAFAGVVIDDPDAALAPIQVIGEPPSGRKTAAEREKWRVKRRVIDPREIDDLRAVIGGVNDVGLCGQNADEASFGHHLMLGVGKQVACGEGTGAQALNRSHRVVRLGEKNFAELFRPREIFVHPADRVRVVGEGAHTIVPRLVVDLQGVVAGLEVAGGEDNLRGSRRRGEHNRDQGVGVECDRAE